MTLGTLVLAQLVMFHTAHWSPDGARLLITTMDDDPERSGFVYDLSRDELRPISSTRLRELERDWVTHNVAPQLTEQRTSSGQVIALNTGSGPRILSRERWAEQPGLSPDGRYVVYEARENPHDVLASWIVVVDTAGDTRRRLHSGTDPSWSPDGTSIVFKTAVNGVLHIATASLTGGAARILAPGVHPAWSPDGRRIAYMVDGGARSDIWIMNSDGSARKCVTCSTRQRI